MKHMTTTVILSGLVLVAIAITLIQQNNHTKALESLEAQRGTLEKQVTSLHSKYERVNEKANKAEEKVGDLTGELFEARNNLEKTAAELEAEKAQAEKLAGERDAAKKEASKWRGEYDHLKKIKAAAQAEKAKRLAVAGGTTTKKEASKVAHAAAPAKKASSKVIGTNFQVTWYNVTGTTRSGRHTRDGLTAAVDPRVIPMGSLIKLTFPDGSTAVREAHDTGGAVKGHIVDIYSSASTAELRKRGRSHGVKVEILRWGW